MEDIRSFLDKYPKFQLVQPNQKHVLEGELDVKGVDNTLFDRFHIKMVLPVKYPSSLPRVYEIDGRIPKVADRHINIHIDNSCCLCIPMKARLFIENEFNLTSFFEELVIPFFANQVYFERTGKWANGEFAHGIAGIMQFYEELFNTKDHSRIVYGLKIATGRFYPPLDFTNCFCGRKRQYSICCKPTIESIKYILKDYILEDIEIIQGKRSGFI